MKKFYIPTTTLNFNNILSSESISPKAFYSRRKFGYQRWENIPENNLENSIVLYGNMCTFSRPESDVEDHPLLIEVKLDETKFNKVSDDVYLSDKTVYLTPLTCNFIFFSQKDMDVTLSMSRSSLETKLEWIYSRHIIVDDGIQEQYQPLSVNDLPLNLLEIENDIRINKVKGLLYGYYIGARLSSSKENVQKLNVRKEIYNIFASILANPNRKPSEIQDKRLDELFDCLNEGNPLKQELLKRFNNDEVIVRDVIAIVKKHCDIRSLLDKESKLYELAYAGKDEDSNYNSAIYWINNLIEGQKRVMSSSLQLLSTDKKEIVVTNSKLVSSQTEFVKEDVEKELFKAWVNDVFTNPDFYNKITSYSRDLSDQITIKAKAVYQDHWDNSETKVFLNGLRRFLRGENFDAHFDNNLLSSVASVLIAGENWEKLLAFMQSKEMTDYRLAFAIWGELYGFANLTRDFTDIIYRNISNNYLMQVYKEFHSQLHNETLEGEIKVEVPVTKDVVVEEIKVETENVASNVSVKISMPPCFKKIFDCSHFKQFSPELQQWYKQKSLEIWSNGKYSRWGKKLKEELSFLPQYCELDKGTTLIWSTCLSVPEKEKTESKKQKVDEGKNPFSDAESVSSIEVKPQEEVLQTKLANATDSNPIFDSNNVDDILNFICTFVTITNEETKKYLKNDLVWTTKYPKSTEAMVEYFKQMLIEGKTKPISKKGKDMKWKNDAYKDLDIDLIIQKLREKYVNTNQQ